MLLVVFTSLVIIMKAQKLLTKTKMFFNVSFFVEYSPQKQTIISRRWRHRPRLKQGLEHY